jgi:hypothetical protein
VRSRDERAGKLLRPDVVVHANVGEALLAVLVSDVAGLVDCVRVRVAVVKLAHRICRLRRCAVAFVECFTHGGHSLGREKIELGPACRVRLIGEKCKLGLVAGCEDAALYVVAGYVR